MIDGRRYKAKTEKLTARLEAIRIEEAKLVAQSGPDSVLAAEDPVAAFEAAPLAIQQQVIDTLATVTLRKGTHGSRTFVPESVTITWRE